MYRINAVLELNIKKIMSDSLCNRLKVIQQELELENTQFNEANLLVHDDFKAIESLVKE